MADEVGEIVQGGVQVGIGHLAEWSQSSHWFQWSVLVNGCNGWTCNCGVKNGWQNRSVVLRGYHNRPELTAEKFVALPGRVGRWYRTGDGGILRGKQLEVVGRFDSQARPKG